MQGERDDGSRELERAALELSEWLPAGLAPLARVAFNYRWTWLPDGPRLFSDMDERLWSRSACNPRWMIQTVLPSRLRALAEDRSYVQRVTAVAQQIEADLRRPPLVGPVQRERPVAYFCSEFGAHCSLSLYGGGLGVLAGDVLKSASDLALPMVGVGLLFREGYFHQRLGIDGWQFEYWTRTDFELSPVVLVRDATGRPLTVEVVIRGRTVHVQIWRAELGRVPLYLLDTDREDNHPIDRWITARLYIGDRHTRLAQYAVLGVAGARALKAMGIEPGIVHLNEGHAALAAFARIHEHVAAGASPEEALERVRASTVFTTHTPVAAGNEWYPRDEIEPALGSLAKDLEIQPKLFYGLGAFDVDSSSEPVNITVLALRTSRAANAVARRHGEVARPMWQRLWPDRPVDEVPITHVTNGVHTTTWMAPPMQALLDRHLAPDWRERAADPAVWEGVERIPDEELWAVRGEMRRHLVEYARDISVQHRLSRGESPDYVEAANRMFHPEALTIGFARRVAMYKRLYLLTRHLDWGLRLLASEDRPIQIVLAGKAHPQDSEAKEVLKQLFTVRRAPHVGSRIIFLEDYDLHMAPRIVAGVDLWLNVPRPPLEASGTSGMKVVLNGGLNLSVLDGWWHEAYDGESGWAIASRDGDPQAQDEEDATALYDLLEHEAIPLFYERDGAGLPHRWLARVKKSLSRFGPRFSGARMMQDYVARLYGTSAGKAQ